VTSASEVEVDEGRVRVGENVAGAGSGGVAADESPEEGEKPIHVDGRRTSRSATAQCVATPAAEGAQVAAQVIVQVAARMAVRVAVGVSILASHHRTKERNNLVQQLRTRNLVRFMVRHSTRPKAISQRLQRQKLRLQNPPILL